MTMSSEDADILRGQCARERFVKIISEVLQEYLDEYEHHYGPEGWINGTFFHGDPQEIFDDFVQYFPDGLALRRSKRTTKKSPVTLPESPQVPPVALN